MDAKQQAKRQRMIARIQQFTLMDDDFMTRFFDGENACVQVVLQVLLEKPDLTVTEASRTCKDVLFGLMFWHREPNT